jgi:hypothetical protein
LFPKILILREKSSDEDIPDLPLWLKADFRGNVFWALNGDHLDFLERAIRSTLRERPVMSGRRLPFTIRMPFNLPSWMLSQRGKPVAVK